MKANDSKVAEFRQQQILQEEAALLGLNGLAAGFARHLFIETRMQQGAEYILQLIQEGKEEQAQQLMATRSWGQEGLERLEEGKCGMHHTTASY